MKLSADWGDFRDRLDRIHPRYGETMRLPLDEETDTGKGFLETKPSAHSPPMPSSARSWVRSTPGLANGPTLSAWCSLILQAWRVTRAGRASRR